MMSNTKLFNPQDCLKRRSIHNERRHFDKNQKENFGDGIRNSPSKSKNLQNIDEMDLNEQHEENESNHGDEVIDKYYEAKSQKFIGKISHEKARNSQKMNEKVKFDKQILADISNTPTSSFYDKCLRYFKYASPFLLIIMLGLFCLYSPYFSITQKSEPAIEPVSISLKKKLAEIKDRFQDQNKLTFRILEKALEKVVDVTKEPSAPAIFTVIVNKNAIHKSHEFLHSLASTLAPQNTVLINESMSWHGKPDDIKFKIDSEIRSKAEEKKLFIVIVDNLQNIPLKGAMIFHGYCDHELAPFKNAVFLFIIPLNENLSENISSKMIDKVAFQQLKNIWNKATPDEIDSLITRMTVNVINIRNKISIN